MKKRIKKLVIIFIVLIFIIGVLKFTYNYIDENLFKLDEETAEKYLNEVNDYLSNKYKEDMVICDYSYYDTFYAWAYPKNNSELLFSIIDWKNTGVYKDDYVETYLGYTSRKKIEPILNMYYNDYELIQNLNTLPPRDSSEYYYNKYKNIELPISWDNPKCEEFYEELIIDVYDKKEITDEEKKEIKEKISATNVKFNNLIIEKKTNNNITRQIIYYNYKIY